MSNNSLITETFRPHIKAIIQLMDQKLTTSTERSYQADLRSFPEEDGNITAICRKTKVFGTIYIYEVLSKIFWTGATIYTAAVVAQSAGRW
jgi:hypothetical protein